MKRIFESRGFTLVELLIVLGIIALLAAVVIGSLGAAREKARDAQRLSDLANIKLAMEVYFEENGTFPPASGKIGAGEGGAANSYLTDYFNEIPTDPFGPGDDTYFYEYDINLCSGVIYANAMEGENKGNKTEVCSGDSDSEDTAHYIRL